MCMIVVHDLKCCQRLIYAGRRLAHRFHRFQKAGPLDMTHTVHALPQILGSRIPRILDIDAIEYSSKVLAACPQACLVQTEPLKQ